MNDFPLTYEQNKSKYNRRLIFLFLFLLFFSWNWFVSENEVRNLLYIGHSCVTESLVGVEDLNERLDVYLGLQRTEP